MCKYLYSIVVILERQVLKFQATYSSDWEAQDATLQQYPQARLIYPQRLGRVQ